MLAAHVDVRTKAVRIAYERGRVSAAAMADAIARVDVRLRIRHWAHRLASFGRRGERR